MSLANSRLIPSVETIRGDFPGLLRKHGGQQVAYFDGPGGTQVPMAVGHAVIDYLYNHNANTRWEYPSSQETDSTILRAREAMADWLGGNADEMAFGPSMTALTFQLSRVLSRRWASGDNIVVTEQDHHANVDTWKHAASENGVEVRTARVDADGNLDIHDFEKKISSRTRLAAFSAASNVLGVINPVGQLVSIASQYGALTFVDMVHYSGHLVGHVRDWACDFAACSAYKFYGPRVAALWVRKEVLDGLEGLVLAPAPSTGTSKFERGAMNHEGIAGAGAAIEYLATLPGDVGSRRQRLEMVSKELQEREVALFERLWNGVKRIRGLSTVGPAPGRHRTATLSFAVHGLPAKMLSRRLAQAGLFLSHGNFYAQQLVKSLGHANDGLARAGCAIYSTADEVERLLEEIRCIQHEVESA